MSIRRIEQAELARLPGALLVDVREPAEYRGERLAGSRNIPLSRLASAADELPKDRPVVLVCRSGRKAEEAARSLAAAGLRDVLVLEGGLSCCSGLEKGPGGVWALERQVRMAAGALVVLGWALSLVHPGFGLLSAFVGAGLVYSAATDSCGMASVLARMPWNRAEP